LPTASLYRERSLIPSDHSDAPKKIPATDRFWRKAVRDWLLVSESY
jgi:hypothetical protein